MPDINAQFPSKYLRAVDLDEGGQVFTIANVKQELIKSRDGGDEKKPILYFREDEKGLVLNKTNANKITKLLGSSNTDDWIDQPIHLFRTEVQFGADMVDAIRVRQAALPTKAQDARGRGRVSAPPPEPDDPF